MSLLAFPASPGESLAALRNCSRWTPQTRSKDVTSSSSVSQHHPSVHPFSQANTCFRRRYNRLHNSVLPHPPPVLQPSPAHRHRPRSQRHRCRRIRQSRRSSCLMGLPELPRPAILPPTCRARGRAQRRREVGLSQAGVRKHKCHRQAGRSEEAAATSWNNNNTRC